MSPSVPVRVSCIIPAYNEAGTIGPVVEAARGCPRVGEVIVVSDGSGDETAARARQAGADRVIVLPHNHGKAQAVFRALEEAGGEIILLLDADLCGLTSAHLDALLAPVLAGDADMTLAHLADDPLHAVFGRLSGQRAVRRHLLEGFAVLPKGYGIELALDRVARRAHVHVTNVTVAGVTHRRKRQKYGTVEGLRRQIRATADVALQAGSFRRHRPAGRRRRRAAASWMVPIAAITMSIFFAPVLLGSPGRVAASGIPVLAPFSDGERVLVVAAHPDDEVIGAGGLIAMARRAGVPVTVVVLTNGDANRLAAAVTGRHPRPHHDDFIRIGRLRQQEALRALSRLGLAPDRVVFLGFPDRSLARVLEAGARPVVSPFTGLDHAAYPGVLRPDAPYTRTALLDLFRTVLVQARPTVIITHAPFDRHGDHQAAYELARLSAHQATIYTYLVHAAKFPSPFRSSPKAALLPPHGGLPEGWTWHRLDLPPDVEAAKQDAVRQYRSQLASPYLRLLLGSFVRTNELFAVTSR